MGRRSKQKENRAVQTATAEPQEDRAEIAAGEATTSAVPGWWAWLAALAGGLAGGLAFEPFNFFPLIILAPLGCFLAIRWSASPRGAFLRALAFGWVYYFVSLHWLLRIRFYAPAEFLGVLGVMALAVYIGLYPALVGFVLRRWIWTRCATFQYVLFGSLWLLAEWFRTLGRLAVPLAELGHAWATFPWLIQIAAWLGELGVSLLVLACAGLLFLAGRLWTLHRFDRAADPQAARAHARLRWIVPACAVALAACLACSAFVARSWGSRINNALGTLGTKRLQVALLQPNIPQGAKLDSYSPFVPEATRRSLQGQITQIQEEMLAAHAHGQWGLIVLPETSFTEQDFNRNKALQDRVSAMAIKAQADLLISASREESTDKQLEVYNTAYFVKKDGVFDTAVYDKMRLVPFGEAIPYFDLIPGVQSMVGIGSFNEGKTRTLFSTNGFHFGTLICFESTFSSMARALVKKGSDFLAVVTNDAWYEWRDPNQPYNADVYNNTGAAAHHHLSLLRAVETRRWVLRCANTGISSIISPAGAVTANGDQNWRGMIQGTIVPEVFTGKTVFTYLGNGWMLLPFGLVCATLALRRRAAKG